MRSSNGWLVSNTVDECLQRKIAQKTFNGCHRRADQSRTKRIEGYQKFRIEIYMFLGFSGFKLFLAEYSVRNRVSKNVTNLCDPKTSNTRNRWGPKCSLKVDPGNLWRTLHELMTTDSLLASVAALLDGLQSDDLICCYCSLVTQDRYTI